MSGEHRNQEPGRIFAEPPEKNVRQSVRHSNSASLPSPQATALFRQLKLPNDGAFPGTVVTNTSSRQRRVVRDLDAVHDQLTERDYAVLRMTWTHRVLTTRQVQCLAFGDLSDDSGLRQTQQTLKKLRELWILGMSRQQRHRHRRGRPESIYYVDVVGERLLRTERTGARRYQWKEPSMHYLNHQLAIGDVHVQLLQAERRGGLELVDCDVEPASWRTSTGWGSPSTLKPDLFIQTTTSPSSDLVDGFFIEVDLGTESIPTLIRKCHEYRAYWATGAEQDDDGNGFPLVIWHMTHTDPHVAARRRAALADRIERDRRLDPELFRIVAPDQLLALITNEGDL